MTAKLVRGLHWHRALFDDQTISGGTLGDGPGHTLDGGKVSVAIVQRRRSYTDENALTPVNRIFGGTELQAIFAAALTEKLFQMGFEKGQVAILQLRQFCGSFSLQKLHGRAPPGKRKWSILHNLRRLQRFSF